MLRGMRIRLSTASRQAGIANQKLQKQRELYALLGHRGTLRVRARESRREWFRTSLIMARVRICMHHRTLRSLRTDRYIESCGQGSRYQIKMVLSSHLAQLTSDLWIESPLCVHGLLG